MKHYKPLYTIFILFLSATLFIGCSKPLDNENAKNAIIKRFGYPTSESAKFACGKVNITFFMAGKQTQLYEFMKERNLITYQVAPQAITTGFAFTPYTVNLTPEGEKLNMGPGTVNADVSNPLMLKVTELHFNGITGIRKVEGAKWTEVKYSCVQHITPYAEALNKIYNTTYVEGQTFNYTVKIAETDNGWAVQ